MRGHLNLGQPFRYIIKKTCDICVISLSVTFYFPALIFVHRGYHVDPVTYSLMISEYPLVQIFSPFPTELVRGSDNLGSHDCQYRRNCFFYYRHNLTSLLEFLEKMVVLKIILKNPLTCNALQKRSKKKEILFTRKLRNLLYYKH